MLVTIYLSRYHLVKRRESAEAIEAKALLIAAGTPLTVKIKLWLPEAEHKLVLVTEYRYSQSIQAGDLRRAISAAIHDL